MKVYRGYNKEVGPISYAHWTYVTPDIEQAKWYATKDGSVEDGAIIEYDMDKDHMSWITLSKINSFAENDDEYYTEEDMYNNLSGMYKDFYPDLADELIIPDTYTFEKNVLRAATFNEKARDLLENLAEAFKTKTSVKMTNISYILSSCPY